MVLNSITNREDVSTSWLDEELCLEPPLKLIGGAYIISKKDVTTKDNTLSRISSQRSSPRKGSTKLRPNLISKVLPTSSGSQVKRVAGTKSIPGMKKGDSVASSSMPFDHQAANKENRDNQVPSQGVQKPLANHPINTSKELASSEQLTSRKRVTFKSPLPSKKSISKDEHTTPATPHGPQHPSAASFTTETGDYPNDPQDTDDIIVCPMDELNPTSYHPAPIQSEPKATPELSEFDSPYISPELLARYAHLRKPVLVTEVPEFISPADIAREISPLYTDATGRAIGISFSRQLEYERIRAEGMFKPKYEGGTYKITKVDEPEATRLLSDFSSNRDKAVEPFKLHKLPERMRSCSLKNGKDVTPLFSKKMSVQQISHTNLRELHHLSHDNLLKKHVGTLHVHPSIQTTVEMECTVQNSSSPSGTGSGGTKATKSGTAEISMEMQPKRHLRRGNLSKLIVYWKMATASHASVRTSVRHRCSLRSPITVVYPNFSVHSLSNQTLTDDSVVLDHTHYSRR
ncbi:hypothetical protein PROFUN_12529 [Planoprotostelium fungivorum]|uniref:Uncharacterized protein n=1 Tax=Planoprotostelium fungivorum TaxID=1890364 RepID=A0A2P6MS40_9EUKA|nr:hypothetical protein PROFUN_12529 [Planoprotostelium fungivorum]